MNYKLFDEFITLQALFKELGEDVSYESEIQSK